MFERRQGEIYRIWFVNDPSGKCYVGQTVNGARARVRQHIAEAADGKGGCPLLDKACRKFGSDNMRYEILANNIYDREELNAAEKFWIEQYNSQSPHGYNVQAGGYHAKGSTGSVNAPTQIGLTGIFDNPLAATVARAVVSNADVSPKTRSLISAILGI